MAPVLLGGHTAILGVLLRITAPPDDQTAREMADRFRTEGFCPFGRTNQLLGFVRSVEMIDPGYVITVEITEPVAAEYFAKMVQADQG